MREDLKENLSDANHWLRLLLTLIYALLFYVGVLALGLVVALNLIVLLLTGARNDDLAEVGARVSRYLQQIMAYATLNSDERPFPFGDGSAADGTAHDGRGAAPPAPPGAAADPGESPAHRPAAADSAAGAAAGSGKAGGAKAGRKKSRRKAGKKSAARRNPGAAAGPAPEDTAPEGAPGAAPGESGRDAD